MRHMGVHTYIPHFLKRRTPTCRSSTGRFTGKYYIDGAAAILCRTLRNFDEIECEDNHFRKHSRTFFYAFYS